MQVHLTEDQRKEIMGDIRSWVEAEYRALETGETLDEYLEDMCEDADDPEVENALWREASKGHLSLRYQYSTESAIDAIAKVVLEGIQSGNNGDLPIEDFWGEWVDQFEEDDAQYFFGCTCLIWRNQDITDRPETVANTLAEER